MNKRRRMKHYSFSAIQSDRQRESRAYIKQAYRSNKYWIYFGSYGWGIRKTSKSGAKSINRVRHALRASCPIPPASGLRASLAEHMKRRDNFTEEAHERGASEHQTLVSKQGRIGDCASPNNRAQRLITFAEGTYLREEK